MLGWVSDNPYRGHRFPKEIIFECVWLYFRFRVSFRDVEEMMAAARCSADLRVHCWCDKCGKEYADGHRNCRPPIFRGSATGCSRR
jgi:putative transposase